MIYTNWLKKLQDWILAVTCSLCGTHPHGDKAICLPCLEALPRISDPCMNCGFPITDSNTKICGQCLQSPPPFERLIPCFAYQPPIDKFITAIKFNQKLNIAQLLGQCLLDYLQPRLNEKPQAIIPVPLHVKRLKQRGFNQALEIARPIAKALDIPLRNHIIKRIQPTAPQTLVEANARHKNVKNAFAIDEAPNLKHVAIIDDVVTTANTVSEISRVLKKNGVEKIEIWCCARALGDHA